MCIYVFNRLFLYFFIKNFCKKKWIDIRGSVKSFFIKIGHKLLSVDMHSQASLLYTINLQIFQQLFPVIIEA